MINSVCFESRSLKYGPLYVLYVVELYVFVCICMYLYVLVCSRMICSEGLQVTSRMLSIMTFALWICIASTSITVFADLLRSKYKTLPSTSYLYIDDDDNKPVWPSCADGGLEIYLHQPLMFHIHPSLRSYNNCP